MSREVEDALASLEVDAEEESIEEVEEESSEVEEESEEESEEEPKEIEEEPTPETQTTSYKAVKTKYPEFFKDFPKLRQDFFAINRYREVFGSVDEAKEAAEELDGLREMESAISSGEASDLQSIIKTMPEDALPKLAANFLPSLQKVSNDAYYSAITPLMGQFVRALHDAGVKNSNDNLKNAGLLAAQHFFGDMKVASGEKEIASSAEGKTDDKLEKERESFRQERYITLYNDVVQSCDTQLIESIKEGLDPKKSMSADMQELISEKVKAEIDKTLNSDKAHVNHMNSLWKKASKENFSGSNKARIANAYLARAREIMPGIRSKIRNSVLGVKVRKKAETEGNANRRREPNNTSGGQRQVKDLKNLDTSKIDWSKTSDLDLIKGNVTYKK